MTSLVGIGDTCVSYNQSDTALQERLTAIPQASSRATATSRQASS
jgi:hypothetical protein